MKALHYTAKRAFENVLVTTKEVDNSLQISVINDSFQPVTDTLTVTLLTLDGTVLLTDSKTITSNPNSNDMVWSYGKLDEVRFDTKKTLMKSTFGAHQTLHYFVKPKDMQLTNAPITVSFEKNDASISIFLTSETLQKDVFLSADVPGHFEDNFFDMLPGEHKTIQFIPKKEIPNNVVVNTLNRILANKETSVPTHSVSIND